jgi:hypothetical protein
MMRRHANMLLTPSMCSYNPSTDLETGLGHFVEWYLDYYGQGSKNEASLQGYKPY